ncbi:RNA-directed DNA polymerase, eukaryota [Tanacetum coccineum]
MVKWIMTCVTSTKFSININGERVGYFKGGRGLRQGDPVSPYLFTLVMEVLNLLIKKNIEENEDLNNTWIIKKSLDEFSGYLGLLPNMPKSTIFFRGLSSAEQNNILSIIPFTVGKAKVSWDAVCKPKDQGGLGLKNLGIWNEVLMVKHLWNVASKKDTLWVKWISVEILKGWSIWEAQSESNCSVGWKNILSLRDKVKSHIWWKIGNGRSVNVWCGMINGVLLAL